MSHRFATVNKQSPAAKARRAKYDSAAHRKARIHYAAEIAAGRGRCWRCGRSIPQGTPTAYRGRPGWVVGHDDHDINIIRGAECYPCNHHAATRKGALTTNAKRTSNRPSPAWTPPFRW